MVNRYFKSIDRGGIDNWLVVCVQINNQPSWAKWNFRNWHLWSFELWPHSSRSHLTIYIPSNAQCVVISFSSWIFFLRISYFSHYIYVYAFEIWLHNKKKSASETTTTTTRRSVKTLFFLRPRFVTTANK